MPFDEPFQDTTGGDRGGEFDGVDAGVDPVGRLGVVGAGRGIGDGDEEKVATLERLAVRLDGDQVGVGGRQLFDPLDEFGVSQEPVEAVVVEQAGHAGRLRSARTPTGVSARQSGAAGT